MPISKSKRASTDDTIVLPPTKKPARETSETFNELSESDAPKPWTQPHPTTAAELAELAELRRQNEALAAEVRSRASEIDGLRAECETLKQPAAPRASMVETRSLANLPTNAEIVVIASDTPLADAVLARIADRLVSDETSAVEFVLNRVGSTYYACQKQSEPIVDKIRHAVVNALHKKIAGFKRTLKGPAPDSPSAAAKSDFAQTRALVDVRAPETVVGYLCQRFPAVETAVDMVGYDDFVEAMCEPNGTFPPHTEGRFAAIGALIQSADAANDAPVLAHASFAVAVKALRLAQSIYHGYHIDRVEVNETGGEFSIGSSDPKTLCYGTFTLSETDTFTFTDGIPADFVSLLSNYYQTNSTRKAQSSRRSSQKE